MPRTAVTAALHGSRYGESNRKAHVQKEVGKYQNCTWSVDKRKRDGRSTKGIKKGRLDVIKKSTNHGAGVSGGCARAEELTDAFGSAV